MDVMTRLFTRRRALASTAGILGAAGGLRLTGSARAAGNFASNPITLPELKIDTRNLAYSQDSYELETGKYYFWTITSDGEEDDIAFTAPELFRNSWINQIVIDGLEVHANAFHQIEFDDAGSQQIQFVPIRPGRFDFWTPGYENRGLKGSVLVN